MVLERLFLKNFRLYRQATVAFTPGVNLVFGENAQGKTSLLEALAVLLLGEGVPGAGARELVHWGEEEARLEAEVRAAGRRTRLRALLKRGQGIGHYVEEAPVRLGEIFRFFPLVVFWPADGEILRGEPQRRRQFLDGMLARLSRRYLADLRRYRRALAQRNACLRSGRRELLEVWEEEMATYGGRVAAERYAALHFLTHKVEEIYGALSDGRETLILRYLSNWSEGKEDPTAQLRLALRRHRTRELRFGQTLVGPHRDDLGFLLNGHDLRSQASRGQQKNGALALRLAQAALVAARLDQKPLILLDDAFAELDCRRREWLARYLQEQDQVVLTAADGRLVPGNLTVSRRLSVQGGKVVEESAG